MLIKNPPNIDDTNFEQFLATSPLNIKMFYDFLQDSRDNLLNYEALVEFLSNVFYEHERFVNFSLYSPLFRSLTEIAIEMKHIYKSTSLTGSLYRFIRSGGAEVFYSVDGSVPYVLDMFVEYFQPLLDDNKDSNAQLAVNSHRYNCSSLLYMVTFYLFESHPAVQDLCWDLNIATMVFRLSKLRLRIDNIGEDFYIHWMLLSILHNILRVSARERTKIRELGGVKWITELSAELLAVESDDTREKYDKLIKDFSDVQQVITDEQE